MSNNEATEQKPDEIGKFLTFRSRIGRGWYLAGIGGEIVILLIGVMAAAGLNNPTGGGNIFLALIFPLMALLVHISLVIGRVRHAGGHALLGLLLAIAPYAWIALTLEYIESIGWLMLIVFVGLYLVPALFKPKAEPVPQP